MNDTDRLEKRQEALKRYYEKVGYKDVTASYYYVNIPRRFLEALASGEINVLQYLVLCWLRRWVDHRTGIVHRCSAGRILNDLYPERGPEKKPPKLRTIHRTLNKLEKLEFLKLPDKYRTRENYPIYLRDYVVKVVVNDDEAQWALRPTEDNAYGDEGDWLDGAVTEPGRTRDEEVSKPRPSGDEAESKPCPTGDDSSLSTPSPSGPPREHVSTSTQHEVGEGEGSAPSASAPAPPPGGRASSQNQKSGSANGNGHVLPLKLPEGKFADFWDMWTADYNGVAAAEIRRMFLWHWHYGNKDSRWHLENFSLNHFKKHFQEMMDKVPPPGEFDMTTPPLPPGPPSGNEDIEMLEGRGPSDEDDDREPEEKPKPLDTKHHEIYYAIKRSSTGLTFNELCGQFDLMPEFMTVFLDYLMGRSLVRQALGRYEVMEESSVSWDDLVAKKADLLASA